MIPPGLIPPGPPEKGLITRRKGQYWHEGVMTLTGNG